MMSIRDYINDDVLIDKLNNSTQADVARELKTSKTQVKNIINKKGIKKIVKWYKPEGETQ